jgi:hypothetical protein
METHPARVKLPKFAARVDSLFERVQRPVKQGEIALDVGCSLEQVEREMKSLCDLGAYRRAEVEELKKLGWDVRVIAFVRLGTKI